MLEDILVPAIIFYSMYAILRELFSYLIKRRLIKSDNIDKANLLGQINIGNDTYPQLQKYNSLKWGLVALFAGIGLLIIAINPTLNGLEEPVRSMASLGIIMISVALAFLLHFAIVVRLKK